MSLHQSNPNKLPDSMYMKGSLKFLVKGNSCVLLDGRRTPGFIEELNHDSCMFTWKITDFEDKGRTWILPFEDIKKFQFLSDAKQLTDDEVKQYQVMIDALDQDLEIIKDNEQYMQTINEIESIKEEVLRWFEKHGRYFQQHQTIDLSKDQGSALLFDDVKKYMDHHNLLDLEEETTDLLCLNPNSGELMKGMNICLAEMGLISYRGKVPRSKHLFEGNYTKERRKMYLKHRLAFVHAIFESSGINEIVVFRGMTSEKRFMSMNRPFISTTASLKTAKEFFDESYNKKIKTSYLLKLTIDVSDILFTYIETELFNKQYLEQEVILLNTSELPL